VSRILLCLIALFVPSASRPRWREEWLAETGEIARVRGRLASLRAVTGAIPDALAVRRRARSARTGAPGHPFRGTGDDVRYAIRSLLASPGFSLPVAGSLSLGIASMIAAFTLINAIMFRPFPGVIDQDRLVRIDATSPCGAPRNCASIPTRSDDYKTLREAMTTLDGLAAYVGDTVAVTIDGRAHALRATAVSEDYFRVLGVRPFIGRTFAAGARDDESVVIAHTLWVREFGSDPDVLGRFVTLGAAGGARVIGVAPPHFVGARRGDVGLMGPGVEIWMPLPMARRAFAPIKDRNAGLLDDGDRYFTFIGRMRPGVTVEQVASQARVAVRAMTAGRPNGRTDGIADVTRVWFNDPTFFAATIAAMLAVPALVLVIACLNAANLLVARGARRRREMAVRTALGATRWQIVRQVLIESVLLALAAAVVSVPLAAWTLSAAMAFVDLPMPIDYRVITFASSIALLSAIAFGTVPAVRLSATRPWTVLGTSRPGDEGRGRMRRTLVVVQVALSLGLLATGTQLIAFLPAQVQSAGTEPGQLVMASFDVGQVRMDRTRSEAFYRHLRDRVAALPDADGTGVARRTAVWMFGRGMSGSALSIARPEDKPRDATLAVGGYAGGDLFKAVGLPLVRGRLFTRDDEGPTPRVAIVNRVLAAKLFGEAALGRTIRVAPWPRSAGVVPLEVTIVGIVEAAREPSYRREPMPAAYLPVPLEEEAQLTLYVRTRTSSEALAAAIRRVAAEVDQTVPPLQISTLAAITEQRQFPDRLTAQGVTLLGIIGLLLAATGLYAVMSYLVSLRSREIGVRLALGAAPGSILRMTLREALTLAVIGTGIGAVGALVTSKVVQAQMHGVQGLDPVPFAGSIFVLGAAMLIASAIPARRATRVDPITVLRQE
jgi:putative ABC transport system permease protein